MDSQEEKMAMDIRNYNSLRSNSNENKYRVLENNHRKLLAVTSALTEALENTIRGDDFNMEEILNNCMRIYPELFVFSLKKPPPKTNFNKTYNTSDVSDVEKRFSEDFTDSNPYPAESSKSAIFMGPDANKKEIKGSHFNPIQPIRISGIPHYSGEPSQHGNLNSSPRVFVEQPTPTFQRRPILEMNLKPNKENEDIIIKNLSDTSPYLVESPDVSDCSTSNYFDKTMRKTRNKNPNGNREINETKELENFEHRINNNYLVGDPRNSEQGQHMHQEEMKNKNIPLLNLDPNMRPASRKNSMDSQYSAEIRNQVTQNYNQKDQEQHYSKPIEIIVQKKMQGDQNSSLGSEADVLIRIRPEAVMEGKNMSNDSHDTEHDKNRRFSTSSTMTQTLCRRPAETCIIITNQVDSNYFKEDNMSNNPGVPTAEHHNNLSPRMHNQEAGVAVNENKLTQDVTYDSLTESKNVTIQKLQHLSTALKVHADVMQSPDVKQSHPTDESKHLNTADLVFEKLDRLQSPQVVGRNNERRSSSDFVVITNDESQITFDNIKNELLNGTVKQKATMVQSLRLKLIHTLAKDRSRLVSSYTENDILSLSYNSTLLKKLLPSEIINGWDLILQEMTFKFLNTLSSMWKGRDYLSSNLRTLKCLQNYFDNKYSSKSPTDSLSIDMLVAVFHKLTTKPNQQILLVNSGIAEKILPNVLENYDCMSPYRLRHSLGLLINLCVDEHAREVIQSMAEETIPLLSVLLKSKDKKIVSYVVKFTYVLMANEVFHKTAKDKQLVKIIDELLTKSNKRMKLQLGVLKTIIEQASPHQNFVNSEYSFLQNREAELEELEEEVEHGEPYYLSGLNFEENRPVENENFWKKNETEVSQLAQTNEKNVTKNQDTKPKITPKQRNIPKNAEKREAKSNIPNLTKAPPNITKTAKSAGIKSDDKMKRRNPGKGLSKGKISQGVRPAVQHEIDEEYDPAVSDTVLKDILGKIMREQSDQQVENNTGTNENNNYGDPEHIIINNRHNKTVEIDNKTSFIILNNHKSNKFVNADNEKSKDAEDSQKGSPSSKSDSTTTSASSNFSLFDKNKSYDQDYDYCEDTKQIQTPIRYDNIFKDNRQSPYRGLVLESKRGNNHSSQANSHRADPLTNNYSILENEYSTTSTD